MLPTFHGLSHSSKKIIGSFREKGNVPAPSLDQIFTSKNESTGPFWIVNFDLNFELPTSSKESFDNYVHSSRTRREDHQNSNDSPNIKSLSSDEGNQRCIKKVIMVEETKYDDNITCKHDYKEQCYTTYVTDFRPEQKKNCEENFRKQCTIEFQKKALFETVTVCHIPLELQGDGPCLCKIVFESICTTRYEEHEVNDDSADCSTIQEESCEVVNHGYSSKEECRKWPRTKCRIDTQTNKKYIPETSCEKIPRSLCGKGSIVVPRPKICVDNKQIFVHRVSPNHKG